MTIKPTSKKGRLHTTYVENGEEAALAMAPGLGIPAGRAKRLIKRWASGAAEPTKKKSARNSTIGGAVHPTQRTIGKRTAAIFPAGRGPRVCLRADERALGRILEEGEQQSVVKWDNGNVDVTINDWIKRFDEGQAVGLRSSK